MHDFFFQFFLSFFNCRGSFDKCDLITGKKPKYPSFAFVEQGSIWNQSVDRLSPNTGPLAILIADGGIKTGTIRGVDI